MNGTVPKQSEHPFWNHIALGFSSTPASLLPQGAKCVAVKGLSRSKCSLCFCLCCSAGQSLSTQGLKGLACQGSLCHCSEVDREYRENGLEIQAPLLPNRALFGILFAEHSVSHVFSTASWFMLRQNWMRPHVNEWMAAGERPEVCQGCLCSYLQSWWELRHTLLSRTCFTYLSPWLHNTKKKRNVNQGWARVVSLSAADLCQHAQSPGFSPHCISRVWWRHL